MATKGSRDCDKVDSIYKPNLMAFLAQSVLVVLHASHAFSGFAFQKRQVNCFHTQRQPE